MLGIALVSCGASKRPEPAPAWSLYTGSLFVAARRDVEARELPYWIVSAEHGLLDPRRVVAPYDRRITSLSPVERIGLGRRVVADLTRIQRLDGVRVELHAGHDYADVLVLPLRNAGADVELVADGLELGARLAYYSTRATERELGPTPRAPFTLLGVERFALDDEGTPDAVTAVATVRWSDVVPALHDGTDTDVVVDDLGFHVKRSSSALSSTLVCRGRAWRVLTSGGVDGATTLLVERSLEALRDGYVGEERARFDRLRRGIADAARAELARPPVWPTGRRWRYRMSTQTIEGEGPIGQITELLVPGVGRVWVREALDLGDGFTTSSNQRWGWKHGDIGRDRQVLQLAAPWWAWSAVAEVVGEIDPLHRRVVHHARWTQDEGRHLADFLPADQRGGTWSSSTTSRVSVWRLVN